MKQLKVIVTAICEVPDDFKLTPSNYCTFAVSHQDGELTRQLRVTEAQVHVKEPKPAKKKLVATT